MPTFRAGFLVGMALIGCTADAQAPEAGAGDAPAGVDRDVGVDARDAPAVPCPRTNSVQVMAVATDGGDGVCTFPIPVAGPLGGTRGGISVYEDDQPIPKDLSHHYGWDYVDETQGFIQMYGVACDPLLAGAVNAICVEYHLGPG